MLFLPDLVIYARKDSFLTRKLQRGTRLTKPKETVPGRRPDAPSMPIVISSDFILHIIPRLIGPVGKESLLTLLHRVPSRPCRLQMLLQKGPPRANSAPHARYPVLLPHVVKVVTNYLAHIVYPHHGYIRPHRGQSIDRCIPIVHRLFIVAGTGRLVSSLPWWSPKERYLWFWTPLQWLLASM